MRTLRFVAGLAVAFLLIAAPGLAQEGHPLKGSWLGTWGMNSATDVQDIIVILDWDGQKITGVINPGIDDIEIQNATLDPDGWVLRFEADVASQSGSTLHYMVEGKIDNLAFHDRTVEGTWTNENGSGPFKIQRQ